MVQGKADDGSLWYIKRLTTSHYGTGKGWRTSHCGTEKGWWWVTNKLTQLPKEGAAWHSHGITWSKGGDSQQPCTAGQDTKQTTARSGRGRREGEGGAKAAYSTAAWCQCPNSNQQTHASTGTAAISIPHMTRNKSKQPSWQVSLKNGGMNGWSTEPKKTMCIHNTTDTYSIKKTIL